MRVNTRIDRNDGDVDLDAFLAGERSLIAKPKKSPLLTPMSNAPDDSPLATNVSVLLQGDKLLLSCPVIDATSSGYAVLTSSISVATVKGKPNVQVRHTQRSSSGFTSEVADLNAKHSGQALLEANGKVPRWLAAFTGQNPKEASNLRRPNYNQRLKRRRAGSDVPISDPENDESTKRRRLDGE